MSLFIQKLERQKVVTHSGDFGHFFHIFIKQNDSCYQVAIFILTQNLLSFIYNVNVSLVSVKLAKKKKKAVTPS